MSGYRYIPRTNSTLRRLQKLRDFEVEFIVKDTATLVSAYNEARASHKHHEELLLWIGKYIPFFEKETTSECCHEALEFAQLANVVPKGPHEKILLEDAFNALCRKIHWGDYGEAKLIDAFNYFLLSVDSKVFEGNPQSLAKIAREIIKKLGSEQTFSRGTYPTHSISLLALHHLCAVIHQVEPTEFDHDKQEGLYQEMSRCLKNIIDSQSYYPFYFQATMTQQSLACMDSNASMSSKEIWYRLFCGVRGIAYVCQAVAGAVCMNFSLESLEKGIAEWIEARTSYRIKQNSWCENVQPLIDATMLVQSNPEKLDTFVQCLSKVEELEDEERNKETKTALRLALIQQVSLLVLGCHDSSVNEWAVVQLSYFGKCCAPKKEWAQDPIILEAMVAAILKVGQKVQFRSDMEGVLETIGFYVGEERMNEVIKYSKKGSQWREEDKESSSSTNRSGCDNLFNKIKKDMSLDGSISTHADTQSMLKKHYQQHSEVQSLFENERSKRINGLDHSLLLYEKIFGPNGRVQIVKSPIPLKDLFKNRQLNPGTLTDKVKRVLLFSNPGTGKTTVAKKIAYKWSIDEWGNAFDMLYLVPVRELSFNKYDDSTLRKQRNLETAITNICFYGQFDENFEALRFQVKEDLDKESTLVVFDGLDEGEEMTKDMIAATESKSCRVMVLSRPQNLHSERNLANVEVECMGLSDEQLVKFIESECLSTELVDHLKVHPNVWEISHTPIVANILTFLYKSQKEYLISEENGINMISLYWNMSDQIWTSYVKKVGHDFERNVIFEALEEIAFRALEDGQILIDQHMVSKYSQNQEMKDILKDCGFLLLKKEGLLYQFPHLTFQEFFAGQYMAQALLSKDEERKQEAVEFLNENKYCANFKQVFCFMIQALTLKKRKKGYFKVEAIVNAGPTALCYQQHLLLNMELLEASLSASKQEDRERILSSTEVLDRAFDWIEHRECFSDELASTIYGSAHNPIFERHFGLLMHSMEEFIKLFVQITKVARCAPEKWKKVKEILEMDLRGKNGMKAVLCISPLMRAIPEQRDYLMELYWDLIGSAKNSTMCAALSHLPDIARLMPNAADQMFERYTSYVGDDINALDVFGSIVDYPRLAEVMPSRWQEILEMIRRPCIVDKISEKLGLYQLERFLEFVPESRIKVMELIRELSVINNKKTRRRVAIVCLSLIRAMPENMTEIAEILWTLCEDGNRDVHNAARGQVVRIMLSWGEIEDPVINTLLRFSEGEPKSPHSSVVQLIAIAHKLVKEKPKSVDSLLSNLSPDDLITFWYELAFCIRDSIGSKTKREMGLHWLHFLILKAVRPPEVDVQELHTMMDNVDSDSINIGIKSAKLLGSAQCPNRRYAPIALCKLAICCPDHEDDLFDTIDGLTQDKDIDVAMGARIQVFSLLEKLLHKTERVINKLHETLRYFKCFHFLRMRGSVSLDALIKAYMMCHNDFLIFWIVWQSFDTPITMETMGNGKTELIVHASTNSKKRYKFQAVEEAKAFASSFDECIDVVFPDVASYVPRPASQERQQSRNPLFASLRDRLIASYFA